MKFCNLQRVTHADVVADGNELGRIGRASWCSSVCQKEDDRPSR